MSEILSEKQAREWYERGIDENSTSNDPKLAKIDSSTPPRCVEKKKRDKKVWSVSFKFCKAGRLMRHPAGTTTIPKRKFSYTSILMKDVHSAQSEMYRAVYKYLHGDLLPYQPSPTLQKRKAAAARDQRHHQRNLQSDDLYAHQHKRLGIETALGKIETRKAVVGQLRPRRRKAAAIEPSPADEPAKKCTVPEAQLAEAKSEISKLEDMVENLKAAAREVVALCDTECDTFDIGDADNTTTETGDDEVEEPSCFVRRNDENWIGQLSDAKAKTLQKRLVTVHGCCQAELRLWQKYQKKLENEPRTNHRKPNWEQTWKKMEKYRRLSGLGFCTKLYQKTLALKVYTKWKNDGVIEACWPATCEKHT